MDKGEGLTSFAVVRRIRALLGGARVGHAGSLDPFATGLLPVCVGRATRLARFVAAGVKRYRGQVRFGQATDTDDRTGQPLGPPAACPEEAAIRQALPEFLGIIEQRPPRYSAKHVGGRRAYRLARAGQPLDLAPARVRVDRLRLVGYDGEVAELDCEVGPGTYIRALARDLGERLGSAAHLAGLRRTGVGPFEVRDAARLEELPDHDAVVGRVLDPLAALQGMPRLLVSEGERGLLRHGRLLPYRAGDDLANGAQRPGAEDAVHCAVAPPCAAPGAGRRERGGLDLIAVVSPTPFGWRPILVWDAGRQPSG